MRCLAISALSPTALPPQPYMMIHPPDEGSVYSQTVTLSPPPSSPLCAESLNSLIQPSTGHIDQQDTLISQSPSPMRSSSQTSSPPLLESPNSLTPSMSIKFDDKEEQSPHLIEQGDPEGSTQSDGVKEDKFDSSFMRSQKKRQNTFLRDERERKHRFLGSEAARGTQRCRGFYASKTGELKRSDVFDQQMKQWSLKSQTEHIRGREEERFRREIQRSVAFRNAESQRRSMFNSFMQDFMDQAYAEEDLEEIHFKRQEDMLLVLYEHQAIQLNQ
ncbi:hypothetical protein C0993_011046 [Termitomyces sp. T159_Od127]|nr:hypothetical protein C0993_011046 [Termitomyces sp. T159_Od127]